jgi:hypothetical protein
MGSFAENPALERAGPEPSIGERLALIERVAASEHFSRSARLRDFLLYVGRQSLKKGSPEIHEQEIGAKVFGRDDSYDRTADTIVRVNATELRKRIDSYFAQNGANEPLIFEIPRGIYKPVFRWRLPAASDEQALMRVETHEATQVSPVSPTSARRYNFAANIVMLCLSLGLIVVCTIQYQQIRTMRVALNPWEGQPAVSALWQDFVKPSQQTDIVLPDASLSIREELTGLPVSLPEYINRQYMNETESLPVSKDRRDDLIDIYSHNLVAFGDFRAAQRILALSPVGSSLHLTLSRFFQAESVKTDNLILIGGKKANPWVYLFDDQMAFSLDFDAASGRGYVANRHPRPGEAASYSPASQYPNGFVGYSVVAYLANPSHNGNVIILTGTDSDATSAAAEFLTSEEQLKKFQNTLHVQTFPYFEVLLKTSRLSGTSLSSEIVAYRAYPSLK